MTLSHGFLPSLLTTDQLSLLRSKVTNLHHSFHSPVYLDNVQTMLSAEDLYISLLRPVAAKLLNIPSPTLLNVELHYLPPNSLPIPSHQDNFYHCLSDPSLGLKILVPLVSFGVSNGSLSFIDVPSSFPTLNHLPSKIPHFSSYIDAKAFSRLKNYTITNYSFEPGDASYHFLSSIHFSQGNQSPTSSKFLVYRFHSPNASEDESMLTSYRKCYKEHVSYINY